MNRTGNLWTDLVSHDNLFASVKAAAAGKRERPDVARFLFEMEGEVVQLRRELLEGRYQPSNYRTFRINDPKPRLISAAPFRDRVVHHALTRVLEPVFERRFARNSYACRRGYGTHKALACAREACRKYPFALKCDIRKYFASIDHAILNTLLGEVVKCKPTLELAARIIEGSNPQEEVIAYFPGDDLFSPFERRRGLPLGNQTSQFFSNVYLNPLDQFVNRRLRAAASARYVDDLLLFGESKSALWQMQQKIQRFLFELRLTLHPQKTRIFRAIDGIPFLGWRIFPDRTRLCRCNVIRFRRHLKALASAYAAGRLDWSGIHPRVRAWISHAEHGDTWRLREQVFASTAFTRGSAA